MPTETLVPWHQSLSLGATHLDSLFGKDGTDIQVAAWGQIIGGSPEDQQSATWDLASAFVTQRAGPLVFQLGRQVISGGAARYRRMDGVLVRANGPVGLRLSGYAGWTALPRWDQWYGYHDLGANYDSWKQPNAYPLYADRSQNTMGGFLLDWHDDDIGTLGVSFHGQAERDSIESRNLGANFALTHFENVSLTGDAIFSLEQQRLADVRFSGLWDAYRKGDVGVSLLGEFLHTVPSALLSQASIFSVFSFGELTEAGGELITRLPLGFTISGAGYAQTYNEGSPGARVRGEVRFASDKEETVMARVQAQRVSLETNGYWVLRLAARYRFLPSWSLAADAYRYAYDQAVDGRTESTFGSTHLVYEPKAPWDARVGATLAESPYASLDAQCMARLALHWDRSVR
ncbi:MAG TPA: hypothetical protein VLC09_03360 [Polyangiaceae bacterium]|nr:hypothetical protein [Polyangiaceae bacterium]